MHCFSNVATILFDCLFGKTAISVAVSKLETIIPTKESFLRHDVLGIFFTSSQGNRQLGNLFIQYVLPFSVEGVASRVRIKLHERPNFSGEARI